MPRFLSQYSCGADVLHLVFDQGHPQMWHVISFNSIAYICMSLIHAIFLWLLVNTFQNW